MMSKKHFAYRAVTLLIVATAITLGNAARVLLFCGVIICSLAKLPWICLNLFCRIGMAAVDSRILAPLHGFSLRAAARHIHRWHFALPPPAYGQPCKAKADSPSRMRRER
jgi:hypothetical protein